MRRAAIENQQRENNYEKLAKWNYESSPKIEGVYLDKLKYDGKFGPTELYVLDVNGVNYAVYTLTTLKNQFDRVPIGSYVWIEYLGEKQSKNTNRTFKDFKVEFDDEYQG